jgi:hypothetical protein
MWLPDIEAMGGDVEQLKTALRLASTEELLKVYDAANYEKVNRILLHQESASGEKEIMPLALGDLDKDLTYTPVSPCRIADTRLAGGPIAGDTNRPFYVYGLQVVQMQGGSVSGCLSPRGEPSAAHVNVTIVPVGTKGHVTVYPYNLSSPPLASAVNFTLGTNIANAQTVQTDWVFNPPSTSTPAWPTNQPIGAPEIRVYANNTTHVILDVLGYFYRTPETSDHLARAYASVSAISNKSSGTTNVKNIIWNNSLKRYEITISGEKYFFSDYTTLVTPNCDNATVKTSSVDNKLLVYFKKSTPPDEGTGIQCAFQFVTFEKR